MDVFSHSKEWARCDSQKSKTLKTLLLQEITEDHPLGNVRFEIVAESVLGEILIQMENAAFDLAVVLPLKTGKPGNNDLPVVTFLLSYEEWTKRYHFGKVQNPHES